MVPVRISPYRPAAWVKPHHEAGHTTAPDHMPERDRKNCLHLAGRPHTLITRIGRDREKARATPAAGIFRWYVGCLGPRGLPKVSITLNSDHTQPLVVQISN